MRRPVPLVVLPPVLQVLPQALLAHLVHPAAPALLVRPAHRVHQVHPGAAALGALLSHN
jgi:hypothetical protein